MPTWMKTVALATMLVGTPHLVMASGVDGVWQTEKGSEGGWLEVTIAPCGSDAAKICGTISAAHSASGPDANYPHLGKLMVKNMIPGGDGTFSDGTIWDPQSDKIFDSHMTLNGNTLDVEGCVSIICSGQDWKRLN